MRLVAVALPILAPIAAAQSSRAAGYPITEVSVARFLQTSGVDIRSSAVHLPMELSARTPNPQLRIVATQRFLDGEVRIQLRCRTAGDCLPFDAIVDSGKDDVLVANVDTIRRNDGEVLNRTPGSGAHGTTTDDEAHALIRAGSRVTLVIQEAKMQIHVPVIAIDSGFRGTAVRVCTLDRKKTFHATVVDSGAVRGVAE